MALPDGGGDLCDDLDRLRTWSSAALRPRAKCDGPGSGVMLVIVVIGLLADKILFSPCGTFSPQALGNRTSLTGRRIK
jgi:hypothetical protein